MKSDSGLTTDQTYPSAEPAYLSLNSASTMTCRGRAPDTASPPAGPARRVGQFHHGGSGYRQGTPVIALDSVTAAIGEPAPNLAGGRDFCRLDRPPARQRRAAPAECSNRHACPAARRPGCSRGRAPRGRGSGADLARRSAGSSFLTSISHWFFIELILMLGGFVRCCSWNARGTAEVPSRAESATRSRVVRDRTRDVPALPAGQAETPAQVDVLLVHVEALVQVLAADLDRLERGSARDEGGAADAEDLILAVELPRVSLVLSPVDDAAITADHVTRRVDDVGLPVGIEVVAEDLARRAPARGWRSKNADISST